MTKRQFVVLAFRLFALYLVFNLLTSLGYFFGSFRLIGFGGGVSDILAPTFALCIILFLISLLWRKSEWVMQKVFAIPILSDEIPNPPQEVTNQSPNEGAQGISENEHTIEEIPEV